MAGRELLVVIASLLVMLPLPEPRADNDGSGVRWLEPRLRFDNLANFPDYVFYLRYRRFEGNPRQGSVHVIPVSASEPILLAGTGLGLRDLVLLAVPRRLTPPPGDGNGSWPNENIPGVLRSSLLEEPIGWSPAGDRTDYYVTPYRVALGQGRIHLLKLPIEPVRSESSYGGFDLAFCSVILAGVLVLIGVSLWVMRRGLAVRGS